MILSVYERLILQGMLPEKSNLVDQMLIKDILNKVAITQEEVSKFGIETEGQAVKWKENAEVEIVFSEAEKNLLRNAGKKIDEEKQVDQRNMALVQKLIG